MAVAASVASGGDGRVRVDACERDRGGRALEGERGRGAGGRVALVGASGRGRQASRRWSLGHGRVDTPLPVGRG